jgi:TolA-binding protein
LEQARTQFETVIREYPNTEEALLARNQLQKIEQQ